MVYIGNRKSYILIKWRKKQHKVLSIMYHTTLNWYKLQKRNMVLFKGHHCATVFKKYTNGNTRIDLIDSYTCTPVTTATTSIDMLAENEVAIREFSDHIGILETLVNAGIVSKPIRYINSGHNNVPVCRLINRPVMV